MRRLRVAGILVFSVGLVGFFLGCQPRPAPDTRAADERAIREVDAACLKAAQARDVEGNLAFYADDASIFPPNAPIATGKEAIRTVWSPLFGSLGYALSWQATKVEVSRAGDLAHSVGTYELTLNNPKGKPVTDRGKYVTVWKKQADGTWKVAVDIWNSDPPPPATPTG